VIDVLAPQAREKGLALSAFVSPPARGSFRGDPTRLRQVLTNLAGNAMKFTASGSVTIQVSRVDEADGAGGDALLRCEIIDTGIGIPAAARTRLFEKFNQADNSVTRRFGGTGLGLAISKQLTELMGGTIEVESEEGLGSTFRFTIPLAPASDAAPEERVSSRLAGLRGLIVDDAQINRRICRSQLEGFGLLVTETAEVGAALREVRRAAEAGEPYDVVVVDHRVPGIGGAMLAPSIRSLPGLAGARLILASSSVLRREQDAATRDSFDAILLKPVHRRDLLHCLTQFFDPAPVPERAEHGRAMPPPGGVGKRVLLAEDNLINQRIAVGFLRKAGYEVDTALDGVEALAAIRAADYDVVLMDVQMPRCDGLQAAQRIRALPADKASVPIIAMTAHAMAGARDEYLAAGMDDYISKPIDPRAFLAMVGRWVQRRRGESAIVPPVPATPSLPVLDESRVDSLIGLMSASEFTALGPAPPRRIRDRPASAGDAVPAGARREPRRQPDRPHVGIRIRRAGHDVARIDDGARCPRRDADGRGRSRRTPGGRARSGQHGGQFRRLPSGECRRPAGRSLPEPRSCRGQGRRRGNRRRRRGGACRRDDEVPPRRCMTSAAGAAPPSSRLVGAGW
jgi:CheY-like chemotaxis protein